MWEEETWEVVHQIAAHIPSYKVMNQHRWSQVLHQNWFLVASEVGIPLCVGGHHTKDKCTSPTQYKTTSVRGDEKRMPQEKYCRAVTQWPTSKAFLGWKNGRLWLIPWISTGTSTEDRSRPQVKWFGCRPQKEHVCKAEGWCLYPLMLADSEHKDECYHSLNWVMAGKAKQKGGEWVSNPHVRVKDKVVCLSDAECSYPPRGTHTDCRVLASYPSKNQTRIDSQCTRMCSSKRKGGNTRAPKPLSYHSR